MKSIVSMSCRLIVLFFLVLSQCASAADWPRFRGADGNAAAPEADIPLTWSATENMLWKSPVPGNGASSAAVFGGHVYLTSFTGYGLDPDAPGDRSDLMLHVLCFDQADGSRLWDQSFAASGAEQKATPRVADHGYATGSPTCDELGVYAYFGVSGVIAFDHDGNERWRAATGDQTAGFGSAASPILYQNLVIVNASIEASTVFAFDRNTGKEIWKIDDVERSWTTPIVGTASNGSVELIISYKEHVRGFDPQSAEELWHCTGVQDYVVPCVVVNAGIAYVLGGRKNQSLAIRLGGRGDVTETHTIWSTNIGANVTSPIYHEGKLYWASDRGIANCTDAKTGDKIYQQRMETGKARVYASSVLAGDRMYLTTRSNGIFAVALGTEYQQLAHNVIDGDDSMFNATPSIAGNTMLLRTNNYLYCVGKTK